MADLTGSTLGRYQVVERLGRGGMADVYKAYQPGLDRYVALKVMHPHLADQPEFITRFEREARAIARLRHPNIIQVFDFDVQEGSYFMAMEYVEGSQSLKEVLAEFSHNGERLTLVQILQIIAKMADALEYAHHLGMIHRDVKPANILIPDLDTPMLSDFGIARLAGLSSLTATNLSIGTPAYMAPEQGKGEPASERSDIYALGIVLYECLTGKPPYDADTPFGVILKHINSPLIPPHLVIKNLPDDVERIVLKSLAKNPEDRYTSAALMRDALNTASKRAMKNKITLERAPSAGQTLQKQEDRSEASTIVEEEDKGIPVAAESQGRYEDPTLVTDTEVELAFTETQQDQTGIEPDQSEVEPVLEKLVVKQKEIQQKGKLSRRNLGLVAVGALIVIAAGYFVLNYLRAGSVQQLIPYARGYQICNLNNKCELIEFPVEEFDNSYLFGDASWSPDGSRFVFSACQSAEICGLYISDLNGNVNPLIPVGGDLNAINPAWSPDGTHIAFHGSGGLYLSDLYGGRTLLVEGSEINCPYGIAWSADSQWIAWIGGQCGVSSNYVYIVNRNDSGWQEIYNNPELQLLNTMIAWSPDGKSIVFMDQNETTHRIELECVAGEGCSPGEQSTLNDFPVTWLGSFYPQWQVQH